MCGTLKYSRQRESIKRFLISGHDHFQRRKCHTLLDVNLEDEGFIDQMAIRNFAGMIDGHSVMYYGLCPECSK